MPDRSGQHQPPADSCAGRLFRSLTFPPVSSAIQELGLSIAIAVAFGGALLLCLAPLFGGWR